MRRLVKENLLTFDGKRLVPRSAGRRRSTTTSARMSSVSTKRSAPTCRRAWVERRRSSRVVTVDEAGDRLLLAALQRRLASSPEAIFQSLRRRKEKLTSQLLQAEKAGKLADARRLDGRLADPDGFDSDDFADDEFERLEDEAIENVMSAESLVELEPKITELRLLELLASEVRASGQDRKWVELRNISFAVR